MGARKNGAREGNTRVSLSRPVLSYAVTSKRVLRSLLGGHLVGSLCQALRRSESRENKVVRK